MLNIRGLQDAHTNPGNPGAWVSQIFRSQLMLRSLPNGFSASYYDGFDPREVYDTLDAEVENENENEDRFDFIAHFEKVFDGADLVMRVGQGDLRCEVWTYNDTVIQFISQPRNCSLTIGANSFEEAKGLCDDFGRDVPVYEPQARETEAEIHLWMWENRGEASGPRQISDFYTVPTWDDIQGNYPASINDRLAHLVGFTTDAFDAGRVVIMHGPPGTGKTHVVRALAREWKSWASCHYILDAENFFGNPVYMTDLAFRLAEHDHVVFIIEDCGEFITQDSEHRGNQSLARLLNLADGILGQNLNLSLVMTTNEHIDNLHPALSRPGRCAAVIEFPPFTADEAGKWLADHGSESTEVDGDTTIADLYSRIRPVV